MKENKWIIIKNGKYYYGESLTHTVVPVYGDDSDQARVFKNKDFAEMVAYRYGGKVVAWTEELMPATA